MSTPPLSSPTGSSPTGSSSAGTTRTLGYRLAVYTGLRVAAFVVCYLLLLLVGLRGLLAIAAGLLVSSLASLFLLRRERDAVTAGLEARRVERAAEQARLRALLDEGGAGSAGP